MTTKKQREQVEAKRSEAYRLFASVTRWKEIFYTCSKLERSAKDINYSISSGFLSDEIERELFYQFEGQLKELSDTVQIAYYRALQRRKDAGYGDSFPLAF